MWTLLSYKQSIQKQATQKHLNGKAPDLRQPRNKVINKTKLNPRIPVPVWRNNYADRPLLLQNQFEGYQGAYLRQ